MFWDFQETTTHFEPELDGSAIYVLNAYFIFVLLSLYLSCPCNSPVKDDDVYFTEES